MKITGLLSALLLCNAVSFAQNITHEAQAGLAKTFSRFMGSAQIVWDTAMTDFNNDGLKDIAVVAAEKDDQDKNRSLIILTNTASDYVLSVKADNAVLCASCGGIFGDPYAGISFKKNVLTINHYGGSAWRWTSDFTFRFQNNQWELIGISQDSYFNAEDCGGKGVGEAGRNLKEINFSTKKVHIIETAGTNCKPKKDRWTKLSSAPKILLKNFDVDKDYFKEIGF
jgi:hypothetical protein